jgi:hypothetical protein
LASKRSCCISWSSVPHRCWLSTMCRKRNFDTVRYTSSVPTTQKGLWRFLPSSEGIRVSTMHFR